MKQGDVINDKYELLRLLGEGGMGEVWEGRHTLIGRKVALKFLHERFAHDPELKIRFRREAQAAAAIGSEHIVNVEDVGFTAEGIPFLVMELLDGEDLATILRAEGPLEVVRAVGYLLQACRALTLAHELGIVHRDLKPENLFLTMREDGAPWIKIIDFGIAKLLTTIASESNPALTARGMTLGSPFYMAPEQIRSTAGIDHRTDIYAMGVILYELVTNKRPFEGRTVNEVILSVSVDPPIPPRTHRPDLDQAFEEVILCAISRDPDDRYQTVADLAEALEPFAGDEGATPSRPLQKSQRATRPERPPRGDPEAEAATSSPGSATDMAWPSLVDRDDEASPAPHRRPWLLVAVAAGVLLVGGVVGVALSSGESEEGTERAGDASPVAVSSARPAKAAPSVEAGAAETSHLGDEGDEGVPAAAELTLTVRAEPLAARVRVDGDDVGGVPFEGRFARDGEEHLIEVIAEGYAPSSHRLTFEEDRVLEVGLTRLAKRSPRKASRAEPAARQETKAAPAQEPAVKTAGPRELEPDRRNPYGAQ